jgi:hypothetical protein
MSRGSTIIPVQPRFLGIATLCCYLGRSETWFAEHRVELESEGFPRPDPLLGGYDRVAVDLWLDRRSDIARTPALAGARSWDKPSR